MLTLYYTCSGLSYKLLPTRRARCERGSRPRARRGHRLMGAYEIRCRDCDAEVPRAPYHRTCPACGGDIAFRYDLADVRFDRDLPGIWRFIDLLPVDDPAG